MPINKLDFNTGRIVSLPTESPIGNIFRELRQYQIDKADRANKEADRAWLLQQRDRQEAEWDRADKERAALDTYNKIAAGDRNVIADSITDAYLANKGKYALPEVKESMTPEQKAEVLRAQEEWSKNIVKDPRFLESDLDRLQRAKAAAEKEGVLPAGIYDRIRASEAAGEQARQEAIKLADKEVQDSLLAAAKERTRLAELGIKSSGSKSDSKVNAAKAVNDVLKDMKIQPNDATLKQMNLVAQDMKTSGFDQDSIKQAIARGFKPNESGWSNLFMGKGERYEIPNIGLRASNNNVERPVVGDTTTRALLESRYLDALNRRKLLDMTPAEQRAMAIRQGLERVTPEVTRTSVRSTPADVVRSRSTEPKVSPKGSTVTPEQPSRVTPTTEKEVLQSMYKKPERNIFGQLVQDETPTEASSIPRLIENTWKSLFNDKEVEQKTQKERIDDMIDIASKSTLIPSEINKFLEEMENSKRPADVKRAKEIKKAILEKRAERLNY